MSSEIQCTVRPHALVSPVLLALTFTRGTNASGDGLARPGDLVATWRFNDDGMQGTEPAQFFLDHTQPKTGCYFSLE